MEQKNYKLKTKMHLHSRGVYIYSINFFTIDPSSLFPLCDKRYEIEVNGAAPKKPRTAM